MRNPLIATCLLMLALSAIAQAAQPTPQGSADQPVATIETSMGNLTCVLFPKAAPLGTANFIGLARGTKGWTDPKTGKTMHGVPLYDNTTFHRVIPQFMIQGGDPAGSGAGDIGFKFKNETWPDLHFDQPGRLAYANAGPDTNGSQFFIVTADACSWLDGKHTVFGQVTEGMDVVDKLEGVSTDGGDRPTDPVGIASIELSS